MYILSRRWSCLVLALLCWCVQSFAQSRWEQLEPTLKDSTEKATVNFYLLASKDLFFANRKQSLSFAEKGYAAAQKDGAYINELGDLCNMLGLIAMYNEQYDRADGYLQKTLEVGRQQRNDVLLRKGLINLALNSMRRGDYQKSIVQNLELLPVLETAKDLEGMANTYGNISNAYYYLNQLDRSEAYQKKALDLFRKTGHDRGVANAYNTLGSIATDRKDYQAALNYLLAALRLKEKLVDSTGIANASVNLGEVYDKLDRFPEAVAALSRAEAIYRSLHEETGLAKVYGNLGTYYARQKEYASAARYQKMAVTLAEKTHDSYVLGTIYDNLSNSYTHLKSLDTALDFSRKALATKDSLYNSDLQRQISEMEARYETEKKERIINQQQAELARRRAELREGQLDLLRRNYALGGISVLLVSLLVIGYLLYRRAQMKQQARLRETLYRQQQQNAQAVLEAEEKERIRIAQDLHDGVGQMMSIAKMNLSSIEGSWPLERIQRTQLGDVIGLVDDSCREVRTVSHNLMPNALIRGGLGAAIREFTDKIHSGTLMIDLYVEGLEQRLDPTLETVLYRVVQECVNNVIRHARATQLDISLIRDREGMSITVEDNGTGFSTGSKKNEDGIGLSNMATRIAYLGGTIEWDSTPGRGTLVAVHVPLD